ncbi:MAG: DUF3854 domain-containing protein [Gemmatimonadaceae bacterium]|nr:DUF3854 domain-containing protein [Gloeobacterales cyanobacterium ES-bin-141]
MPDTDHAKEWVEGSGVNPEIVSLNVRTLLADTSNPYDGRAFPIAEFLNWEVKLAAHTRERRLPPFERGWSCNGLDPYSGWSRMMWGCFKPDRPRPKVDDNGVPKVKDTGEPDWQKYEHPRKMPTRVFFLDVPWSVWKKVARRYRVGVKLSERRRGFWAWVVAHPEIPVIVVEGAKKAGCLLTLGHVAVALPGVFNGYRRREEVESTIRTLTPDLQLFAQQGRRIFICFDHDVKPQTIRNVRMAIDQTGRLYLLAGAEVLIIDLPGGTQKVGIDDFVVARGAHAFEEAFAAALPLEQWSALNHYRLTHAPTVTFNRRYLEKLPFPRSGLCFVKSAKGTGKTQALEPVVASALRWGRPTIVVTNRVVLGRAICHRLGVEWVEDLRSSEVGQLLGFGLCIDSLHPGSQARFDPSRWTGAVVVLDEWEQDLWHALDSATCREHRVAILQTLRELLQTVLTTGGLVIALDADLSDLSVDFLMEYAGVEGAPWIALNEWKPECGSEVTIYDTSTPAPLVAEAERWVADGQPIMICLDSQKASSKWGSLNMESYFLKKFPDKKILRIDSETVSEPGHPAYGCVNNLNEVIKGYDIIICTPTIAAGVSIDEPSPIRAVFGVYQGAVPVTEGQQQLARVREFVPRFVWARPFGVGKVAGGAMSYKQLLKSQNRLLKQNLLLLHEADSFDVDQACEPITRRTWAKMAARINAAMFRYREAFVRGLEAEGHQVSIISDTEVRESVAALSAQLASAEDSGDVAAAEACMAELAPLVEALAARKEEAQFVGEAVEEVRQTNQLAAAEAVSAAADIDEQEYRALKDKRSKSKEEKYSEAKYLLHQRYGQTVSARLKLLDDAGWHPKIRLHYYLVHHPDYVRMRDRREWRGHFERGGGQFCPQDVRLLTHQVEALRALGLPALMDPHREVHADDPDVKALAERAKRCAKDVKIFLGLTIHPDASPVEVVQLLLGKLGAPLEYLRREKLPDGSRRRVYQWREPDDDRKTVFTSWEVRDRAAAEKGEATPGNLVDWLSPGEPAGATLPVEGPPPDHRSNQSTPGPTSANSSPITGSGKCRDIASP